MQAIEGITVTNLVATVSFLFYQWERVTHITPVNLALSMNPTVNAEMK
jgi:hypothetical protein